MGVGLFTGREVSESTGAVWAMRRRKMRLQGVEKASHAYRKCTENAPRTRRVCTDNEPRVCRHFVSFLSRFYRGFVHFSLFLRPAPLCDLRTKTHGTPRKMIGRTGACQVARSFPMPGPVWLECVVPYPPGDGRKGDLGDFLTGESCINYGQDTDDKMSSLLLSNPYIIDCCCADSEKETDRHRDTETDV